MKLILVITLIGLMLSITAIASIWLFAKILDRFEDKK